jgi:hypothetical protein
MGVVHTDPETLTLTTTSGSMTLGDGPLAHGILNAIAINYTGVPGTTVLTFTDTLAGVTRTLLAVTGNTDGFFSPMQPTHENGDGSVIADQWTPAILFGSPITVAATITGAGSITVSLVVIQ